MDVPAFPVLNFSKLTYFFATDLLTHLPTPMLGFGY